MKSTEEVDVIENSSSNTDDDVLNDQSEFEYKESKNPMITFTPKFVSPKINIEFGSFATYDLPEIVQKTHAKVDIRDAISIEEIEEKTHAKDDLDLHEAEQKSPATDNIRDEKIEQETPATDDLPDVDDLRDEKIDQKTHATDDFPEVRQKSLDVDDIRDEKIEHETHATNDVPKLKQKTRATDDIRDVEIERETPAIDDLHVEDTKEVQRDSVSEITDHQLEKDAKFPQNKYLIKVEDENLKERCMKAYKAYNRAKKAKLEDHRKAFNAANSEWVTTLRLIKSKRKEIESLESVLTRVKNAITVKDMDIKISNAEHRMEHETLSLDDETKFNREIKGIKLLCNLLRKNMASEDELQHESHNKDVIEERLMTLKKELRALKDKASKVEAAALSIRNRYEAEKNHLKELQAKIKANEDYNSFKRLLSDENIIFDENVISARKIAPSRDEAQVYHMGDQKVKKDKEELNINDEFINFFSKFENGAPNTDEPLLPDNTSEQVRTNPVSISSEIIPISADSIVEQENMVSYVKNNKVRTDSVSISSEIIPISAVSAVEQENMVSSVENNQTMENVAHRKRRSKAKKKTKTKEVAKTTTDLRNEIIEEAYKKNTKEEVELLWKEEELRKKEEELKSKEKIRLEEKAKAAAALERKKRNAEKAQMRAEVRAQKETKEKDKAKEKLKKKRASGEGCDIITSENIAKSNESKATVTTVEKPPPSRFLSKKLKPKIVAPPPSVTMAIHNKKKWQHSSKIVISAVLILGLFFLSVTDLVTLPTF